MSISSLTVPSDGKLIPRLRCLCDDTLNNGVAIVKFVEAYTLYVVSGVVTYQILGTFTDDTLQTPYVPLGTVGPCAALGDAALASQERVVLNGVGSFTINQDFISYTIKVLASVGATFTDTESVVTALFAGESISHTQGDFRLDNGATITTGVGDLVIIDYQRLTI